MLHTLWRSFISCKRRLRRREAGDGDAVGGAGDVGEAGPFAEADRGRVAAMFAADAELQVRTRLAAALDG